MATLFLGSVVPAYWAGLVSAGAVVGVTLIGIGVTFLVSWGLSRTLLRGEVSSFSLELPPYRPPLVLQTLYTSLVDRTLLVLWRAVLFAMPAGAVIWLSANLHVGGASVAEHLVQWLDPVGWWLGLNGVILLAYLIAIPANELVIPTVLMLTVMVTGQADFGPGSGVLFRLESGRALLSLLQQGGWTGLTAVNLMVFCLLHHPCSTTLYTVFKETGSWKWTLMAAILPLALGCLATSMIALVWRWMEG